MNTKTAAPAVDTRNAAVIALLVEACTAGATMLGKTKEAAKAAAPELDKTKSAIEAHAALMAKYKGDLTDHNVRAIFSDALWLLAVSGVQVMVPTMTKGDAKKNGETKTEIPVAAADALDYSKHTMRDAAKQVRETLGVSRATGGGRKAETPAATPAAPVAPAKTAVDYVACFADAGEVTRAIAALELLGYKVTKAGKVVKAQKAEQAATPSLAILAATM
jgi:hypothetical protein